MGIIFREAIKKGISGCHPKSIREEGPERGGMLDVKMLVQPQPKSIECRLRWRNDEYVTGCRMFRVNRGMLRDIHGVRGHLMSPWEVSEVIDGEGVPCPKKTLLRPKRLGFEEAGTGTATLYRSEG